VAFFDDLTTLLESVRLLSCPFVVGGDLNINVEDLGDSNGVRLAELLHLFGLTQRVMGPTHQRGGMLDLVVVPQDIADVPTVTLPLGIISDHGLVVADLLIRPVYQAAPSRTVRAGDGEQFAGSGTIYRS